MLPSRSWSVVLALVASLAIGQPSLSAQDASEPCRADARYEALLDWVGDWQVVDGAGHAVGQSSVRSILAGCALEEVRQRTDGSEEVGLTFLDLASDTWRQRWLSSLGHTGLFELEFEGDGVALEGSVHTAEGDETLVRASIAARSEGGFVQQLELSIDGGTVYSAAGVTLYLPPGQASAASSPPPAEPEPSPTPAAPEPSTTPAPSVMPNAGEPEPTGRVKVRSKRKTGLAVTETAMESPMTFEFELGPLADLPPGGAWRTTELAPYVADRVNIPSVTAQKRERRSRTELELVVNLRTRARHSKVDLDAILLSDGESVASERQEGIALGTLIQSHDPKTGRAQKIRFAVDATTFAALFADGKRPSVRLTVTVR